MRGTASDDGATRVAKNGYHYTKSGGKWRLTHHLIAEKNLGRPLRADEGVYFIDRDRNNRSPENIGVRDQRTVSIAAKRARLTSRIAELQAKLDDLNAE